MIAIHDHYVSVFASFFAPDVAESIEPTRDLPTGKKAKSGRKPLAETLPRVRIEDDIPKHEKTCQCGCKKRVLVQKPANSWILSPQSYRYLCMLATSAPVSHAVDKLR